jgi:hypothetical protein
VFEEALALYAHESPDAALALVGRGEPVVPFIVATEVDERFAAYAVD